jgi:hypothetical protein
MAFQTTFKLGLKIAEEASQGTAPADRPFWEGGRWFDIITDGLPDITNRQATIFPPGHAGKRSINQQPPVMGRRWSDGNFTANMRGDYVVPLLHGAMGGLSANSVPSTQAVLLAAASIGDGSVVLTAQPSDGGAILHFTISNLEGDGTLVVRGTDVYGNGASETISISGSGNYFTRTSFSAIGASSITFDGAASGAASVAINGYKYFEYTISASDNNPTFSAEKIGDVATGDAASSFINSRMVVQEMGINTPAAARDGLVSLDCTFEGKFGVIGEATTINDASMVQVVPAWTLNITKDNVNWHRVTNQSFTIGAGNRNIRAAAGTQDPQGVLFGARELTGSHDILIENEEEYNIWLGASRMNLNLVWQTPWKLTSTDWVTISASMANAYVDGEPGHSDDDGALSISQDFRTIAGDNDVAEFTVRTMVPVTAFGLDL